jgi:phosphohistidine phosphatase
MPRLMLLRHSNAIRYNYDDDFNRRLRHKGEKNARKVGKWVLENRLVPGRVYSSPAERAIRTALLFCQSVGLSESDIQLVDDIYPGSSQAFIDLFSEIPAGLESAMIVGHNPALEALLDDLSRDRVPLNHKAKTLSPASLAILSFDGSWSEIEKGTAHLDQVIHSDEL